MTENEEKALDRAIEDCKGFSAPECSRTIITIFLSELNLIKMDETLAEIDGGKSDD